MAWRRKMMKKHIWNKSPVPNFGRRYVWATDLIIWGHLSYKNLFASFYGLTYKNLLNLALTLK